MEVEVEIPPIKENNEHDDDTKFLIMTKNIMMMVQVLTEVTLEVGSLGEEVGVAVPLPQGEKVPFP